MYKMSIHPIQLRAGESTVVLPEGSQIVGVRKGGDALELVILATRSYVLSARKILVVRAGELPATIQKPPRYLGSVLQTLNGVYYYLFEVESENLSPGTEEEVDAVGNMFSELASELRENTVEKPSIEVSSEQLVGLGYGE